MTLRKPDLVTGAVLLLAGCSLGWLAWRDFPPGEGNVPGPAFFPEALCALLAAAGIYLILGALRGGGLGDVNFQSLPGVSRSLLLVVLYIAAFNWSGFLVSTVFFMALMMGAMNVRSPVRLVVVPLLTTLLIWVLFRFYLGVPLP